MEYYYQDCNGDQAGPVAASKIVELVKAKVVRDPSTDTIIFKALFVYV